MTAGVYPMFLFKKGGGLFRGTRNAKNVTMEQDIRKGGWTIYRWGYDFPFQVPQAVRNPLQHVCSRTMSRTGNVRVSFRLRPMNKEEQKEERYGCVKVNQDRARVSVRNDGTTKHFNFDKVSSGNILAISNGTPYIALFMPLRHLC